MTSAVPMRTLMNAKEALYTQDFGQAYSFCDEDRLLQYDYLSPEQLELHLT